ncbi:hypothetical protein HY224_02645 [Candidatus Uhrbacteria bacterium]|nr:hypothetical protein [Candidatus Uhrbacteria bacterium]
MEFFNTIFFLTLACFGIGAIGSLLFLNNDKAANWWSHSWAAAGSAFGILLGASLLQANQTFTFSMDTSFVMLIKLVKIDSLSALFVLLISTLALVCSIYGLGYMDKFYKKYCLGSFGFFYNIFLASLLGVVTAYHGFYFLIVWEIMSLASYFLVIFEHHDEENVRSGTLFILRSRICLNT